MTITITLDHADIAGTNIEEFQAVFGMLQAYAKMTKGTLPVPNHILSPIMAGITKEQAEKAEKIKISSENETESVENSMSRKDIEAEIKQIALDGKEKNASKKIKELIQSYGVEKLSEVPDEKMTELLQKVQAEV